jgi:pimeloyl-ACP methyl ester carboxylesterase
MTTLKLHLTLLDLPDVLDFNAPLRSALKLDKVHLVGHGWGGLLALAYLASRPASDSAQQQQQQQQQHTGVASLSLLATPPSWAAMVADRRAKVGDVVQAAGRASSFGYACLAGPFPVQSHTTHPYNSVSLLASAV